MRLESAADLLQYTTEYISTIASEIGYDSEAAFSRYRGITKNNTWLHHRAAALNLRRLVNLGLTRTSDGTWHSPSPPAGPPTCGGINHL